MKYIQKMLILSVLVAIASITAAAQPSAAQAAALKYAGEIAGYVTSGSRTDYKKFVEANFGGDFVKMPMARHTGFMSMMHDQSRGFELGEVEEWKENEVTVRVRHKLTGEWDALLVRVENTPPYKITGIGLRPVKDAPAVAQSLSTQAVARELEAFVKRLADADVFSGAVVLAKDGQVVYKGAFGAANKDFDVPNRFDTKFNLGSMNKMFTGLAIAQLVEKGKISYDDRLSKFIPDFPNAEAAKKIQIKHLLTHTSGLGGYFSERYDSTSRARIRTVDDMMDLARQDEKDVRFEPGSKSQYSNTGMMVLGKVIEVASGQSYFDYVRDNIYRPAGMTNTDSYELDKVNANLAVGYDKQFTDAGIVWGNNIFAHVMRGGPQGGGYSTVDDLLKFDQALRSGKLISPAGLKLLTSAKPELNSPNYGFGFSIDTARNIVGHSGGFPGISSNLDMYLGSGWTAIVMSNYSRGSGPISQKMGRLIAASK
ncbi:MAG TPA: serine hydrolase domain-containing protein [Pyrinomonadaceae bacterium]|nr:serine hydrolase domain-containing protein [Pyrinomonadaceae bacterium]